MELLWFVILVVLFFKPARSAQNATTPALPDCAVCHSLYHQQAVAHAVYSNNALAPLYQTRRVLQRIKSVSAQTRP